MKIWMRPEMTMLLLSVVLTTTACMAEVQENPPLSTEPAVLYELLLTEGLTCEVKTAVLGLSQEDQDDLFTDVSQNMDRETIATILEGEEKGCDIGIERNDAAPSGDVAVTRQAVIGAGAGEWVEELSFGGGNNAYFLQQDSSSLNWMCNSGSPESPADYVFTGNLYGAWNNRSGIKVTGTATCVSLAIPNGLSSLVYSDNDIRSCMGFFSYHLYCGPGIQPWPSRIRYGLF